MKMRSKMSQKWCEKWLLWMTLLLQFFLPCADCPLSSMNVALFFLICFRSMPLHASSSWHWSITYILIPNISLIIYMPFTIFLPCLPLTIYMHVPYASHASTALPLSIWLTVEQSCSLASLCFPNNKAFFTHWIKLWKQPLAFCIIRSRTTKQRNQQMNR